MLPTPNSNWLLFSSLTLIFTFFPLHFYYKTLFTKYVYRPGDFTLVITFSCISFCYLCSTVTLSFSSSRVPAVMPFLVSLWWQHTLKGRCGGDHTRLVTDLRKDQMAVTACQHAQSLILSFTTFVFTNMNSPFFTCTIVSTLDQILSSVVIPNFTPFFIMFSMFILSWNKH